MDIKDSIRQIAEEFESVKEFIKSEEETKKHLILPFIEELGYKKANEVRLEYLCGDVKKGEKVDIATFKDGELIMLIECKHWQQDLGQHDGQLTKYFNLTSPTPKLGILTNGIVYRFYTDLVETNKMDKEPFLEVNIRNMEGIQEEAPEKFHKSRFNVDDIRRLAKELICMNKLKPLVRDELSEPSTDVVRYFYKKAYPDSDPRKFKKESAPFTELLKRTISNYINDAISERLKAGTAEKENTDKAAAAANEEKGASHAAPPKRTEKRERPKRTKKRERFKFSMVGIQKGEYVIFKPTGEKFKVVNDNSVEYNGRPCKLSTLAREIMPEDKRKKAYQGPIYFTYNGKTLHELRIEMEESKKNSTI